MIMLLLESHFSCLPGLMITFITQKASDCSFHLFFISNKRVHVKTGDKIYSIDAPI